MPLIERVERKNAMPASPDTAASAKPRAEVRPINWPVTVIVFFAGSVLLWADRSNFSVAAAARAKELNWTPSTIGLMLSAFSLGYLIIQPIGGWIADQIGPRRTLAGAMAGWSLWVLLTPLAPTILWLTATFRILLGAFEAPYIPASIAAVSRAIPSRSRAADSRPSCSRARSSDRQRVCSSPGLFCKRPARRFTSSSCSALSASPAPRCGGSSREILPIRCPRARWRKPKKPRSVPRKRRYRRGSS